ncbi:MAG: twin-arginine translocase TatA/TatE family subunit [Alphaproteobacteria bacterium]
MFDIAWSQLVLVFIIALILLGPHELAVVARSLGRWAGQLRRMAHDFYQQIESIEKDDD